MVNIEILLACLKLSAFVYNTTNNISGFNIIQSFENNLYQPKFVIATQDSNLFIAIRGEASFSDFETLLDFEMTDFLGGYVNMGVLKSARYVLEQAEPYMKKYDGKIYFTGHSYGGSVAAMASLIVRLEKTQETYSKRANAITFGSYPFLTKDLAKKSHFFVSGYVANNDLFPALNTHNINNIVNSITHRGTPQAQQGAVLLTQLVIKVGEYFLNETYGPENVSKQQKLDLRKKALNITLTIVKTAPEANKYEVVNPGIVYHIFTQDDHKPEITQFKENIKINDFMEVLQCISDHYILSYLEKIDEAQHAKFPYVHEL